MRGIYINTTAGALTVSDPSIASTLIFSAKRDGIGFNEVASAPGSRDFVYNNSGSLTFSVAFNPGEKVFVLCL